MVIGSNKVKMKDIDIINGTIDKPSKVDKEFQDSLGLVNEDFLGLQNNATHRKYGHDPVLGLAKAMQMNNEYGWQIYMSHLMLDQMSNVVRDSLGSENRDIAEVLFNRMLKEMNNSQKLYKDPPFLQAIKKKYANKMTPKFQKKMKRNKFYRHSQQQENTNSFL